MKNETPLTDFTCINDIKILSNSKISVFFFAIISIWKACRYTKKKTTKLPKNKI